MELLHNLFYGFPEYWGGGVAHSVLILSLVVSLGLCLGIALGCVLAGANTNPPALSYANDLTTSDSPAVGYATVFPFAMFLRIVTIQIFVLVLG